MKQKTLILSAIAFTLLLAVASCSKKQPTRSQSARQAAELYYTFLINGQYESFANCVYTPDSMPTDYRLQLAQAVKQYAENDTRSRGGIADVTVLNDSLSPDSTQDVVTLQLKFGDQTIERVLLPLVFTTEGWKMK